VTFRFLELTVSIFGREAVTTEALILVILQGQEWRSLKTRLPQHLHQPAVEMAFACSVVVSEATGMSPVSSSALQP